MDRIKDFMEEYKLKIIVSLLITIVILLATLFIMIGHHSDDQNAVSQGNVSATTSDVKSNNQTSRTNEHHYQSQFIDIEGAVKRPGVYQFTNNMRVDDAVNLAGGLNSSADRQHINLAKKLMDQQTIYIPIKGEIKGLPGSGDSSNSNGSNSQTNSAESGSGSGKINLNTADAKQLQSIDGIGEKRAEKIVDYRKEHGNFKQINDVKNISGIGNKFFSNIKTHAMV